MMMVTQRQIIVGLEEKKVRTKYGMEFSEKAEKDYRRLLINMIYKLLPIREEEKDWEKYLDSIIEEIGGFVGLFEQIDEISIIRILSKLEGLKIYQNEDDFYNYRKTVLECTNLIK